MTRCELCGQDHSFEWMPGNPYEGRTFTQADRPRLLAMILEPPDWLAGNVDLAGGIFRKRARIVAVRMAIHFTVETDRGPMAGVPGDYIVTNHPDDDPGSDLWSISAERMAATYAPVRESHGDPDIT